MNPRPSPSLSAPARARNRQHRARRWIPVLGTLLLAGLLTLGLWPKPIPVEIAPAVVGPLHSTVNEEGKTRIRQRYLVSAPVAGQLRRIALDPGDEVRAGETVMAVIDPLSPTLLDPRTRSAAEARRDTARTQLETARRAQAFAQSERERFEKLHKEGVVSIQELDGARWRDDAAAGEAAAAESALRQAEAELSGTGPDSAPPGHASPPVEIKAPAGGRVLRVLEENSRVVFAGTPLLEIGDPTDLEVVIEALSRDGATLAPGTRVELLQWGGAQPLEAAVRRVEPAAFTKVSALGVEEQRVNVIADLVTPPDQRPGLGDQFRVEARIILWEDPQALKVPSGALFRRGTDWLVFVVGQERARLRKVRPGRSSGTEIQIETGLRAGEEVILYPSDRVHDGGRIRRIVI